MSKSTSIPKGSTVLVTGANGYLGLHVADQVIQDGYRVRGTVRDITKSSWTTEYFDEKYGAGKFELVEVKDMSADGAFDKILKDVSGVIHVASDVSFSPDPNVVITPVLKAITNILHAAALQPTIKSFVYTSSSAAISNAVLGRPHHINASLWNDAAVANAWQPGPYGRERSGDVYSASKMQAEQKAWEIVKNAPAGFKFNSVNPNLLLGKTLHPKQNKSTGGWVLGLRDNEAMPIAILQSFPPQWEVDVVDVAKLHVIALTDPEVKGERLLGYVEKVSYNTLAAKLGELLGSDKVAHLKPIPEGEPDLSTVDVARSDELLKAYQGGKGFKSLDESLRETLASA